jgi:hypothetical protein
LEEYVQDTIEEMNESNREFIGLKFSIEEIRKMLRKEISLEKGFNSLN